MITRSTLTNLTIPGLKSVYYDSYDSSTSMYQDVFNMNTSNRAFEDWTGVAGVGIAEEKLEGQPVIYKDPSVLTPKRVAMITYGLGMRVTMEAQQDNLYAALKNYASLIGEAHAQREEIEAANIFNLGFGTTLATGFDGLALFSTSHPITGTAFVPSTTVPTSRTGTTGSNRLATDSDLDYTSIQDMTTLLRRTVNEQGNFMPLQPTTLLVPPELDFVADELLKSTTRPDTANRATSTVTTLGLKKVTWYWLLDTDAWFMGAARHDLQFFRRMPLSVESRPATDGTRDMLIDGVQRFGIGFHNWRGWGGTPGA